MKNKIKIFIILAILATILTIINSTYCLTSFHNDETGYLDSVHSLVYEGKMSGWNLRNAFFPLVLSASLFPLKLLNIGDAAIKIKFIRILFILITNGVMSLALFMLSKKILKNEKILIYSSILVLFNPFWINLISTYWPDGPITALSFLSVVFLIYSIVKKETKYLIGSGLVLGAAYLTKYSIGVMLFGLLSVLIIYHLKELKQMIIKSLILGSSFFSMFILGGILDKITWGTYFSSIHKFVIYQVIDKGYLAYLGCVPAYKYLLIILETPWLILLFALALFGAYKLLKKEKKLSLSLLIIPVVYIIIMSLSCWKELRYLWPIVPFISVLAANALIEIKNKKQKIYLLGLLIIFMGFINFDWLISWIGSFTSDGTCNPCKILNNKGLFFVLGSLIVIVSYLINKFKSKLIRKIIFILILVLPLVSTVFVISSLKCDGCFQFYKNELDEKIGTNVATMTPCNMPYFVFSGVNYTKFYDTPDSKKELPNTFSDFDIIILPESFKLPNSEYYTINSSEFKALIKE